MLTELFDELKEAAPSKGCPEGCLFVEGHDADLGLSYDVVVGYEAPVASDLGIVTINAHRKTNYLTGLPTEEATKSAVC